MNQFRLLALGTLLVSAVPGPAQQTASGTAAVEKEGGGQRTSQTDAATVEQQLKVLSEKLDLSGDQQARIKPILQGLHDATQKLVQDKSLTHEERLAEVRPLRYKADKQMREILSEDQKKKLDQFEQGPEHVIMHGGLSGSVSSAKQ